MKSPLSFPIKFVYPVIALALLLGLIFFSVQYGRASTTIVVNSTIDSLANDDMCTLREAIIAANKDRRSGSKPNECPAGSGADTIMLPSNIGDIVLTRADNGKENSSATGDLDILNDVNILGDGEGVTIVGVSGDHVFHILSGVVSIQDVTVTGGNLSTNGGGIRNEAQLSLRRVTISGNTAGENGGAIYNAPSGVLTIANSTISGNQAGGSGGGLYNEGTVNLNNVTVAENTAIDGSGITNGAGVLNIQNSILAGNLSSSDCSGTLTSNGYNLIEDPSGCMIVGDTTGNLTGVNPLLGMLGDNGGNTSTHDLGEGSPAIDAGSPAVPGSGGNACELTDQRGTYRPHGEACDIGALETGTTNSSLVVRAFSEGDTTTVVGRLTSTPETSFTLQLYTSSNPDDVCYTSENGTFIGELEVTTDSGGDVIFTESIETAIPHGELIVATTTDPGGFSSGYSNCVRVGAGNDSWPHALRLGNPDNPVFEQDSIDQYIDLTAQSRWFKIKVEPHSKMIVTLTDLPANYDLTVYKDIAQAFKSINSNDDLLRLGAEFAADAFSADAFSADAFSADAFSADAFSADAFSADAFSADAFSADAFSADAFSADAFSADAFSADAFSADAFSADAFSADAFSADAFSADAFSADAFSSAQTRSLIAISAFDGQVSEGILVNTWTSEEDFYIRVRGRNGVFNPQTPFHLEVRQIVGDNCINFSSENLPPSNMSAVAGDYETIILWNPDRMESRVDNTPEDVAALSTRLNTFADRLEVKGVIVDVSQDDRVAESFIRSDGNPGCPAAQNQLAASIKYLVDIYRVENPQLKYVVIIGGDDMLPFFRHPDHAMLGNEQNYVPPVRNETFSQSSLRLGYVLSDNDYGTIQTISYKDDEFPIPALAVGRVVETASDAITMLDAYLSTPGGVVVPTNYLITAYDFLEDTGLAVLNELEAGVGVTDDLHLITPRDVAPTDESSWTADQLRAELLGERHSLVFLGGHFTGNSALAADFSTRILAEELANSSLDMTNMIIFSVGCHVGYNIVGPHGVEGLTRQPDWAEAAAKKGITILGGTGYQFGDTDFIKYSEQIYLEFSRQLRVGEINEPVSIGQALVKAKQAYLAENPYLRGIDEKAVLEATLFGLPMLSVNMQGERLSEAEEMSIVSPEMLMGYEDNPGATLGLEYADVPISTPTDLYSIELDHVGDTVETSTATYYSGEDTIVVKPNEPVLPMQVENASVNGKVLRGVGFREGTYSDLLDVLPLTGAAATEIRGVHPPFLSDYFFPNQLYSVNYFDALADAEGGITNLFLYPAQYRSSSPSSLTGTWRTFQSMGLRLFYSSNTETFTDANDVISVPALAAAPTIAVVSSEIGDGEVTFRMRVVGNPAAGIQEVWVTYTDVSDPAGGSWQSLDLIQNSSNSTLWEGTLDLQGVSAEQIRYIVQAVNGVGVVSLSTNQGGYYIPGAEAGPSTPTELEIVAPAPELSSGEYATDVTLSARLTSNGNPLEPGQAVMLSLGPQSRLGLTDEFGYATAKLSIYGQPGEAQIRASFAGVGDYQASNATQEFTILKQDTQIELDIQDGYPDEAAIHATLTDIEGNVLGEETLIFFIDGPAGTYGEALTTDYAGRVSLEEIPLPNGSFTVQVFFSGVIPPYNLNLSDSRYNPALPASGTINLYNHVPITADDVYQVDEDMTLSVDALGVLGNDSDPDGHSLSALLVTGPSHGTLTLNSDGSFSYTPNADFNGSDSFTYAAYDGFDSVSALVSITVNPVNDAPIALDDAYSVDEDNVLTVEAPGVLENDSDVDADGLSTSLISAPASGDLVFNSDGSFSYTPPPDFYGVVSFTYQASDGEALSNVATVIITVVSVNDPPVCTAVADIDSLWPPNNALTLVTISGAEDPEGDPVSITILSVFQDEPVGPEPDAFIYGDSVDLRAERDGNGDGRVYHITYIVDDGNGGNCSAEILLGVVDHDQSGNLEPVDGGALYDSTVAE